MPMPDIPRYVFIFYHYSIPNCKNDFNKMTMDQASLLNPKSPIGRGRLTALGILTNISVYRSVVQKLMFFTGAMIILPIVTFFLCQYLFNNNSIVSGGVAALMANVVLIGYVVVAFMEDTRTPEEIEQESKKQI